MAEQSGERRLELSGERVSLWSLIFEKKEKDYLTEKKAKDDKMKKILFLLMLIPMIGLGEPNGYFSWDRATDTFTMIADVAQVDTVTASNITASGTLDVTGDVTALDDVFIGDNLSVTGAVDIGETLVVASNLTAYTVEFSATNIYNDLRFPFSAVDLPGLGGDPAISIVGTNGAVNAGGSIFTLVFSQNDYLFFNPQMSHDYWPGSMLKPHLHSISTDTSLTNTYDLIYSYATIGEPFSAQQTNTVEISTSGVAGEHELHNLGDMDGIGTSPVGEVSGMIGVRLQRTDSGTGINLLEFDIHYVVEFAGGQPYP